MTLAIEPHHAPRSVRRFLRRPAGAIVAILLSLGGIGAQAQEQPGAKPTTAPVIQTRPAGGTALVRTPLADGVLHVLANRSTVIKTRVPYKNVSIAQPDVADVSLVGPQDILLTAKKPGNTQLIIWDDEDRSQVVEVSVGFDLQALQNQIGRIFPASRIEVSSLNGTVALRGRVPNLQEAERAEQVAAPYGQKVLNFLEISGGQQIMLQIRFAEISRSASTSLGFNAFLSDGRSRFGWNNGPGASPIGGLATGNPQTVINPAVSVFGSGQANQTSFEYFVSALRTNNLLRVLAEPNLVVKSGSQGSFLAGGEFPVPVPQTGGGGGNTAITVEYKQFGVRLDFMPVVLGDGRIRLKVTPEVSDLDFSRSVSFNGFVIPSITKRTLTTEIELNEGQTFAVAGLLNNRVTANKNVTPFVGDVPILGALFRSVRYERNESELVVLVTPRLVEAMNPDQVSAMPGERWRYPTEGELLWNADLGGPAKDTTAAPPPARPARFHGDYGFTPAR